MILADAIEGSWGYVYKIVSLQRGVEVRRQGLALNGGNEIPSMSMKGLE